MADYLAFFGVLYAMFVALTFLYQLPSRRSEGARGQIKAILLAVAWPVYWVMAAGSITGAVLVPIRSIGTILTVVGEQQARIRAAADGAFLDAYLLIAVLAAAYSVRRSSPRVPGHGIVRWPLFTGF